LSDRHAESSRERMRRVFPNVPLIYGFSSLAPYGRVAGPMLERYFQGNAGEVIGSGRVSPKLLAMFAPSSMVVTAGQREGDANADYRAEACRYYDDRLTAADRIGFMHELSAATCRRCASPSTASRNSSALSAMPTARGRKRAPQPTPLPGTARRARAISRSCAPRRIRRFACG
jgi:hypothetical protein